jgi:hypothetical protein
MQTTIKQFVEQHKVEQVYVNGFFSTLVSLGKAKIVGKVERPAGVRGKPANIFEIDEELAKSLGLQ